MAKPEDPLPSLDELQQRIDAITPGKEQPEDNLGASYSQGMRMGIELLAGAGVGTVIGYYLDKAFHTLPLFLLVFLFLGLAAGMRNILRNIDKV